MAIDPICGMNVDAAQAARKYEYNGEVYYFCSEHCLTQFQENPQRFVPAAAKDEQTTDPVCGMTVDPARAAGKQKHGEEIHYFCSRRCMVKFIANPDAFLKPRPQDAPDNTDAEISTDRAATGPQTSSTGTDGPEISADRVSENPQPDKKDHGRV